MNLMLLKKMWSCPALFSIRRGSSITDKLRTCATNNRRAKERADPVPRDYAFRRTYGSDVVNVLQGSKSFLLDIEGRQKHQLHPGKPSPEHDSQRRRPIALNSLCFIDRFVDQMSLGEPTYLHRACAWSTPSALIGSIPTPQVLVHLLHHHQDRHLQIQNWLFGYQQQRSTTQAFKLPRLSTRDLSVRTPAHQKLRSVRACFIQL
ncbi:hypothetical protein JOM56_000500 [Amanita muscaria]